MLEFRAASAMLAVYFIIAEKNFEVARQTLTTTAIRAKIYLSEGLHGRTFGNNSKSGKCQPTFGRL